MSVNGANPHGAGAREVDGTILRGAGIDTGDDPKDHTDDHTKDDPKDDTKDGAMKLSTRGLYAVTAMADLASNSEGAPVSLGEIARRQEISLPYLEQLFAKLRRALLVTSVRGPGGGYLLARDAAEIRISDIIMAVDEPLSVTRCATASPRGCIGPGRCIAHDLWDELGRHIQLFLNSVTLNDVLENRVLGISQGAAIAPPLAAMQSVAAQN